MIKKLYITYTSPSYILHSNVVDLDKLHSWCIPMGRGDTLTCKKCRVSTLFGHTPVIGSVINGPNKYTYTLQECKVTVLLALLE